MAEDARGMKPTGTMRDPLPLNDPRITAALNAYWHGAPCGAARRKRMRLALLAVAQLPSGPGAKGEEVSDASFNGFAEELPCR